MSTMTRDPGTFHNFVKLTLFLNNDSIVDLFVEFPRLVGVVRAVRRRSTSNLKEDEPKKKTVKTMKSKR